MEKKISTKNKQNFPSKTDEVLFDEIRSLIEQTRSRVASTVNSALVLMNWHIGKRINDEILKNKRAEYGEQIVASLSHQLTAEYGKGFTRTNLIRMRVFAEIFPDLEISASLSHQLSWSHFVEIITIKDQLKRDFYAEMCRIVRCEIKVADYWTQLPDKKLLERKLHEAVIMARGLSERK